MKINPFHISSVNPYRTQQMKADRTAAQTASQTDKLEISSKAKQLSEHTNGSSQRTERIQQLKKEIQSGTYEVQPEQLAKKLLSYYRVIE